MKILLILLLLLSFNVSADDTNCEAGLGLYDEGKFLDAAFVFLTDAQDNKNACSARNLAIMLNNGDGINQNKQVARTWHQRAKEYEQQ